MRIIRTISELKQWRKDQRKQFVRIGFVPTMGFLHAGHLSLVEKAKQHADVVVMSIFVNPLQFGPNEDFERYPRDEARDFHMAEHAGVDVMFAPNVQQMYPQKPLTSVQVHSITEGLCGAKRPGHFDGVAFVVLKLFQLVEPDVACFGLKDAQQVAVIQQLVNDLCVPVEIMPCPILRESDGLAMSSRNVYLNAAEREQALVLSRALFKINHLIQQSNVTVREAKQFIEEEIQRDAPLGTIEYIEIRSFPELIELLDASEISKLEQKHLLIALAVRFGHTRLIDNILIGGSKGGNVHVSIDDEV